MSDNKAISQKAPLEDIMAAMDVVDTLRHQQQLVDRELDTESRQERLLERLRDLYARQGMEVPDHILQEGIQALEDERFQYSPRPASFATRLAGLYVRRKKWGKPLVALCLMAAVLWTGYYFAEVRPQQIARTAIPSQLQNTFEEIRSVAKDPALIAKSEELLNSAQAAFKNDKISIAKQLNSQMDATLQQLRQVYSSRVISRPNELSGVWRTAEINSNTRNYYLIVEALNANGETISLPINNEENGQRKTVRKWGLRVDQRTFNAVAQDKRDDGIIQGNIVGKKRSGYLQPTFSINTTGATITAW